MKQVSIIISFCLLTVMSYAQVGIGTTTPDASSALDISAANSGLLIPRVSLVDVNNNTTPIAAPAISLLVWNTNALVVGGDGVGYYYWDSANWVPFSGGGNTLDQAYDQGGFGAGRIINATDGDFQVNSGRVEFTHNTDATGSVGSGVLEINNSLRLDGNEIITNTGDELLLQFGNNGDLSIDDDTVYVDASTNRVGIGTAVPNATLDARGSAIFNEASGDFDFRVESNSNASMFVVNGGTNRIGIGTAAPNAILDVRGSAIFNETSGDNDFRIESDDDANMFFVNGGTNRVGIGDASPDAKLDVNTTANEPALRISKTTGATDAAYIYNNGTRAGLYINNNSTAANTAGLSVIGSSNSQYAHGVTAVSNGYYANVGMVTGGGETINAGVTGINAAAEVVGVHGRANNANVTTTDKMGGFFNVSASTGNVIPAAAAVGAIIGNTVYKIVGRGIVSTLVRDTAGEERIMVAPESPEALFQDYGIGQLVNGKVTILLDPILTKNIAVDKNHPMKVFVQLEGDCNGVYVTHKTANGFKVVELNNGTSNTKFSYQIIANRADEEQGGRVSKYSEMRFKPFGRKFIVDQEGIHGLEVKNDLEAISEDTSIDKTKDNIIEKKQINNENKSIEE